MQLTLQFPFPNVTVIHFFFLGGKKEKKRGKSKRRTTLQKKKRKWKWKKLLQISTLQEKKNCSKCVEI